MRFRARRGAVAVLALVVALLPAVATGQEAPPAEVATPVTLVDIGAGLGLTREGHSWDLVVGLVDDDLSLIHI